jgi:hypothetical protein
MARRSSIAPVKLAFLVEGDADKAFVEALAPRILGTSSVVRVVRVGGKAAFPSTFSDAARLLDAGYASVFVLVDADTEIVSEIALQKQRLVDVFRRFGLEDRVHVHMAVPMLETWLLAAHRKDPEASAHPKRDLARLTGGDVTSQMSKLAAELPIETARMRSRSFGEFVCALEEFAPSKLQQAS